MDEMQAFPVSTSLNLNFEWVFDQHILL